MTVLQSPRPLGVDPYSTAVLLDPYPFHQQLRAAGPAAEITEHGVYAVGGFEEAGVVLKDHRRFSTTGGIGLADARKPGANFRPLNALLEVDPPDHTRLRSVVNRILSPARVRQWRADMERDAEQLVDRLLDQREVEAVEQLVEAYIFKVFVDAVGVRFDRDAILAIGAMSFNQSGPQNQLFHDAMRRAQPYLQWFEESQQREHVQSTGLAAEFFAAEDAGEIGPGIASNLTRTFVRGGMDSTIAGIGSTLMHLSRNPDQWNWVREQPSRARNAFEEGTRMETPFQVTYRVTLGDTDLHGVHLEADRKVGVYLGSANRDPRRWPEPDRYDAARNTQGHLAFGGGEHNCIGQMMARLESECLIAALARRVKALEPAGEAVWRPVNQMRTLDTLPLRLVAA
ncbi:MAG: cytochrome P450 [Variovorax sp.]|jgi:4-methoxybenzoate monooxygenase (O-demethylating)|nr:MAG: cytochrome P450 [Variovorax sp.]